MAHILRTVTRLRSAVTIIFSMSLWPSAYGPPQRIWQKDIWCDACSLRAERGHGSLILMLYLY